MPNIVYVLTNPAMPGIVKIGMTDKPDVRRRMAEAVHEQVVPTIIGHLINNWFRVRHRKVGFCAVT